MLVNKTTVNCKSKFALLDWRFNIDTNVESQRHFKNTLEVRENKKKTKN